MFTIDFSQDKATILAALPSEPIDLWASEVVAFTRLWLDETLDSFEVNSSGSTGAARVISHSRVAMVHSASRTCRYLGIERSMTALLAIPAGYIGGKMMIVRSAEMGLKLICIAPHANPLGSIERPLDIDFAAFTPMQMSTMLAQPISAQAVILGGGEVSSQLRAELLPLPYPVYETYGMTETISHIALKLLNGDRPADSFTTLDGISISSTDDGCLVIHDPVVSALPITTTDIVERIDAHHFKWMGRADFIINTGGIKINPETVEHKLAAYISSPFFIHGEPDTLLGKRVILVIASSPVIDNLTSILEQVLDKYERPKAIYYRDRLIYSATGKLLRQASYANI
jgi:o-succinylbenzoate---CoA ligase